MLALAFRASCGLTPTMPSTLHGTKAGRRDSTANANALSAASDSRVATDPFSIIYTAARMKEVIMATKGFCAAVMKP